MDWLTLNQKLKLKPKILQITQSIPRNMSTAHMMENTDPNMKITYMVNMKMERKNIMENPGMAPIYQKTYGKKM